MLNREQFQVAVAAAKRQFALLRKKYPELKAHLVLSLPGGQADIDSSPTQILSDFPAMIVAHSTKTTALNLLSRLKSDTATDSEKERLNQLVPELRYEGKCRFELRFDQLNYDLVWRLQGDDLVDRNLTPQTKASIRIVLGTVAHFSEFPNQTSS